MTMSELICDVAIIGFGPTGQVLSLLLGEKGYRVAVFERRPSQYPMPRAVHYDHEIARIFQAAGIAETLADVVEAGGVYEWRNAKGETLLSFDWSEQSVSGWPSSTMFSQPQLEAILDARVRALPTVTVYQGWAVEQVAQTQDAVQLQIRKHTVTSSGELLPAEDRLSVRGRYVIGADGANSFLRQHMRTSLTDLGFLFDWLVVDIIPHEPRKWNPPNLQVCDPVRPTTVVSGGKGRRRWEFMRLPGERVEDLNSSETVWQLLAPWDITPQNATLERHAIYTFKARWADSWRDGRFLLAGDAAHQMPPFAGQGMGAGMRDAVNLAWKLDLVLSGRAEASLLDTYTSERLPQVQSYIQFSIELGKIICISDPEEARMRDEQMLAAHQQSAQGGLPLPLFLHGPGIFLEGDPLAGHMFLQREVARFGKRGWFDDLVGRGFRLISTAGDPAQEFSPDDEAFFTSIGGQIVSLRSSADEHAGQVIDISGAYIDWFSAKNCAVVLTRPDFTIYGTAPDLTGAVKLVRSLREQLHPSSTDERKYTMTEQRQTSPVQEESLDEVIVPARLHHVNLKAYKFEEMRDFYTALIGIHPNAEVGTFGWYTFDIANHRLALMHLPNFTERVEASAGMHHMAFEYDSLDDLMRTYLRLKKIGVLPAACLDHGMTTSFYYRDPDGNYIELQVDNFGLDPAVSTAFMHTPAFLANPIGVPINPESYVAAWQQGASLWELHERSYAGEFVEGAAMIAID
jgi:2-polyprenyl-6-methoxyphenol hydroxylase-like FAD-dependent oxidoreductase/catechol 2,3-dioxygenase-like lactoylglutathione lyase family enzyme